MSVIHDLINEGGMQFAGKITERELEALFETAIERCHIEAIDRNVYTCHALDNIDRYRDRVADPDVVREHVPDDKLGDWRKVVRTAAYVATRDFLNEQAGRDIEALIKAVGEATSRGYKAIALHATCPSGCQPYQRETDWRTAVIFEWTRENGGLRVAALSVSVSGADTLWVQLERE